MGLTTWFYSIVFIYGLTGNRPKTWTGENTDEPWPKFLLDTDIPNARIITYGYDANVSDWTKPASQNTVRQHAQNLVNDSSSLCARPSSKRPIIFVVHSLSSLVYQDALIFCLNPNDKAQRDFLSSTRGIIFMGILNASSPFEFTTVVANFIKICFPVKAANTDILDILKRRSQVLANIKNGFHTLLRNREPSGHPIDIMAFYKELPLTGTGRVSRR
jgi:hypothetical protein